MLWGCGGPTEGSTELPDVGLVDGDGDGAIAAEDCDDGDPLIHPGAYEVCDGVDNDCDGSVDEDDAVDALTFYTDSDGDGFGDPDTRASACVVPSGAVENSEDCDDSNAETAPDSGEQCEDGQDNDCDGLTDCEDGECAAALACEEDCQDGLDNDYNGLADCEDAACWWLEGCEHPAGVYVSVLDGSMELEHRWSRSGDLGWSWEGEVHTVRATGILGSVRVLPEGQASWSGATSSTACRWGVESVSGARSSYEASGGIGDECSASRVGFWIEPGCRLTSSGFLPPALAPSGVGVDSCRMVLSDSQPGFVAEVGGRWYSGSLLSSSVRTESSPGSSGTYRFSERTWYSATITPAPDLLVYP